MTRAFAGTNPLLKPKEKYHYAFLLAMVGAVLLFVPYMIWDNGYFFFYGDFNVQQIPFYQLAHDAVRSGNIFWNWKTDLGANFIGSYSFYLIGSPFFWLTLPFPSWMVPHLIGPLLILKFSCASLTSYAFLTRFVKNKDFAVLGGLLYAFSGFSVYNIFFNHFHEAIVFFPLLLLGLELFMTENRRGPFAFMVFLCALSNYYFFFGMVVFTVLYFIVRCVSGSFRITVPKFLWLAFEAVLGLIMSAVVLLPSIYTILQNTRVEGYLVGWSALAYSKPQRYFYMLQSFFFPPDLPARPVFFNDADAKWSSVAGWLPVFSMVGVIGWLNAKKGNWLKRIINVMMVMAVIPVLNSAFHLFNYAFYCRWFYMPVLMCVLATALALEDNEVKLFSAWKYTFFITAAFILVEAFFPKTKTDGVVTEFGLFDKTYSKRFWITCGIAVAGLVILLLLLRLKKKSVRAFSRAAIASVLVLSVIYSSYFVGTGKTSSFSTKGFIIPTLIQNKNSITLDGVQANTADDYRIDTYECMDNTAMYLGMSSIQAFHSVVPGSVYDFYSYVGVERVVASRPSVNDYALRGLLSVKYLYDYAGDKKSFVQDNGACRMPGWVKNSTQDNFDIFENEYYIPYGFTYDYYLSEAQMDSYSGTDRQLLMLKAMLLDDDQILKYTGVLQNLSSDPENSDSEGNLDPILSSYRYKKDCQNRAATAASTFDVDNRGFTAVTTLQKDNLVFFSVPWEKGWTATVDGNPVDIEKVNVGFMAVLVPGDGKAHTIRFNYMTPGLKAGTLATAGSAGVFIVYCVVWHYINKKRRPDGESIASVPMDPDGIPDPGILIGSAPSPHFTTSQGESGPEPVPGPEPQAPEAPQEPSVFLPQGFVTRDLPSEPPLPQQTPDQPLSEEDAERPGFGISQSSYLDLFSSHSKEPSPEDPAPQPESPENDDTPPKKE